MTMSETELAIIGLLSGSERYGLELVKLSGGAIKRGTVYTTLQRMEAKGFVTSRQEPITPEWIGLPRRLYRPTALGERMSNELLGLRERLQLAWAAR